MRFRPSFALRRRRPVVAIAVAAALVVGTAVVASTLPASAATTLLSQNKPATASSSENGGTPATAAVDGNTGTRWSSAFSDPQWLQVDLGANATVVQVVLNWEAAYATAFQIQVSADAVTWTSVYSTTSGTGGTQTLAVNGNGRYVRMYGTARATGYGYSLWEFQVYGSLDTTTNCGTTNAALGRPATASSSEDAGTPAAAAVDGNTGTRWSSAFSDPQWFQVDLGTSTSVCQVILNWEAAYATAFQIQVSADAVTWTSVYSTTSGTGGTQTLAVNGNGRYVRMYGTARATGYGYSLWEFQVYGSLDTTTNCGTTNAALGHPATASSSEDAGTPAAAAVDGNTGTRWSSAFSDPQWFQVDLGTSTSVCQVILNWEAAYATAFQIQVSADAVTWTSVYSTTSGTGGTQTLAVNGNGRYVRMYGTARATGYGYSLWEFQVYGSLDTTTNCGTTNAALGRPATASSSEDAGTPAAAA